MTKQIRTNQTRTTALRVRCNRHLAPSCFFPLVCATMTACSAPAQVPQFDHVVVVVMENHSFSQILGNANAPYINGLAGENANFTQSFAIEHPSQPNYLDLFSGSNQGVTDNSCPHTFHAANLGGQLIASGFTFAGYSEELPAAGSTVCSAGTAPYTYQRKHNPWVNFSDVPPESNQPFTAFPSDFTTLPTLSFVIPNQCNDMHNLSGCPISPPVTSGDTWLQAHIDAYAQWAKTHDSLLIITFDEDDGSQGNQIATIVAGSLVIPGNYGDTINHYSMLATLQAIYGLTPPLAAAANNASISNVWDTRLFRDGFE